MLGYVLGVYEYYLIFFKQKTAYEMRISDWSSEVCSSDLGDGDRRLCMRSGVCAEKHPVARPLAKLKALVWQFDLHVSSAVPTRAPDLLRIFGRNGKRRVRTSTHIDYRYRVAATSCLIRSIQRQVGGAYEHEIGRAT